MSFALVILILVALFVFRSTVKKASQALPEAADNTLSTLVVASAALNKQVATLAAEATVEQRMRLLEAAKAYQAIGDVDTTDEQILQNMGLLSKK